MPQYSQEYAPIPPDAGYAAAGEGESSIRKLTNPGKPSAARSLSVVYGEENVSGARVGPFDINDPYFIYDEVSDDRHMGKSEVGYLDGHAGDIPPRIKLYHSKEWGWCK